MFSKLNSGIKDFFFKSNQEKTIDLANVIIKDIKNNQIEKKMPEILPTFQIETELYPPPLKIQNSENNPMVDLIFKGLIDKGTDFSKILKSIDLLKDVIPNRIMLLTTAYKTYNIVPADILLDIENHSNDLKSDIVIFESNLNSNTYKRVDEIKAETLIAKNEKNKIVCELIEAKAEVLKLEELLLKYSKIEDEVFSKILNVENNTRGQLRVYNSAVQSVQAELNFHKALINKLPQDKT